MQWESVAHGALPLSFWTLELALNPALLLASPRYLEQSPLPPDAFESSLVGEQHQAYSKAFRKQKGLTLVLGD